MKALKIAVLVLICTLISLLVALLLVAESAAEVEEQLIYSGEGFEGLRGSECSIALGASSVTVVAFPAFRGAEAFPYAAMVDGDHVNVESIGPGGHNVLCLSLATDDAGCIHAVYTCEEYNHAPGDPPHTGYESNLVYSRQTEDGWMSEHVIQDSPELVMGRLVIDDGEKPAVAVWDSGRVYIYRRTKENTWQRVEIRGAPRNVQFLDAAAEMRGDLAILFTLQLPGEDGYELKLGFLCDGIWSETTVARATGMVYANPRSIVWRAPSEIQVIYTAGEDVRWEDARVYRATCRSGSCSTEQIADAHGLSGGIAVSSSGELYASYASFVPPLRFGATEYVDTLAIWDSEGTLATVPIGNGLNRMSTGLEVGESGVILVATQEFVQGGRLLLIRVTQ